MKRFFYSLLPKKIRNLSHLFYAWWGAVKYRHPSEKLFVIGITGTSGKSSTITFLRQLLEHAGYTVGSLSTIDFYIAGENKLNDQKMTMLGRSQIQKYLREMVDKKCDIAIIETTSEGALQHRHKYINYDVMVLTNLYPEHIDSHGSFDNYKQAKLDIFDYVSKCKRKRSKNLTIKPLPALKDEFVQKTAIVNANIEWAEEFLVHAFEKKFIFSRNDKVLYVGRDKIDHEALLVLGREVQVGREGIKFLLDEFEIHASLYGEYNVSNLLSALAVIRAIGADLKIATQAIQHLESAEGRIEFIEDAHEFGFQVIVDYAFEPVAIQELYKVVKMLAPQRIIHVFGSTGGGRDVSRRFTVGEFVGSHADICIVTDEDPYDDDPMHIINDVSSAAVKAGKKEGHNLFKILDRGEAIEKAVTLAEAGDIVLVTGKGSEQGMVVKGEIIEWDDRDAVRDVLKAIAHKTTAA